MRINTKTLPRQNYIQNMARHKIGDALFYNGNSKRHKTF